MKHKGSERTVEIYWWNFGKKTKDFIGPVDEYLKLKGIKVRKAKTDSAFSQKWTFKIYVSCSTVTFEIYENQFYNAAILAIQIFLTILGDKTLLRANRDYKINWR